MPIERGHQQISKNVRFLLWKDGATPDQWPKHLRARLVRSLGSYYWSGPSGDIALRRLLAGAQLDDQEIEDVARSFEISEEELRSADFLQDAGTDVLHENLRQLVGSLEHGGKKRLALELGLDPTTISRWLAAKNRPPSPTLRHLVHYFGLPTGTDLTTEPIFLSPDPLSIVERKEWLRDRIDAMDADDLREIYPALQRLLDEP